MVSRVTLLNLWLGSYWGWGELWHCLWPGSLTSIVNINRWHQSLTLMAAKSAADRQRVGSDIYTQ